MPEMPPPRTVFVNLAHAAAQVTLATLAALCVLLTGTAAPAHAAASTLPGSCGASAATGRFSSASASRLCDGRPHLPQYRECRCRHPDHRVRQRLAGRSSHHDRCRARRRDRRLR